MNYEKELNILKSTQQIQGENIIKYVPELNDLGWLYYKTEEEIRKSLERGKNRKQHRTIEELRAGIGWKNAKDISSSRMKVEKMIIRNIPVRIYMKETLAKHVPVVLFIHGGGFFSGSLDNVDYPCRALADMGEIKVISIDYRLSPEYAYPAALIECQLILDEVYQNYEKYGIDKNNIYIMGDSAGGNLSVATSILDEKLGNNHIKGQILVYPLLSLLKEDTQINADDYLIKEHHDLLRSYIVNIDKLTNNVYDWYARDVDKNNIYLSPLSIEQNFVFPRTLLICGEYDFLKKQNDKFYKKFSNSTDITYIEYGGMIHAFMDKVGDYPQSEDLLLEAVQFIANGGINNEY